MSPHVGDLPITIDEKVRRAHGVVGDLLDAGVDLGLPIVLLLLQSSLKCLRRQNMMGLAQVIIPSSTKGSTPEVGASAELQDRTTGLGAGHTHTHVSG